MSTTPDSVPLARPSEATVLPIIAAIAFCHMLNDLMQSLIPAIYPILKAELVLTFGQIGLITFVFQGTASILQPLVGAYTDRRLLPYSLSFGMALTLSGLVLLAHAHSFAVVLFAVALIGMGSSVFHPDSSRIARLAAGRRKGFAQSLFQVGGNAGSALGPLAAALIVVPFGQISLEWFGIVAMIGMVILWLVGRWYAVEGLVRMQAARARATTSTLPPATIRLAIAILIALMFSKFVYTGAYSSYYTFYLIEKFALTVPQAQIYLFVFLAFVALGTIIGGPIGDRIGRKRVIWVSILGVAPLSLLIPYMGFHGTVVLSALAGMILASAFPAMVVYAQDLLPTKVGMIAGLLFGLAFGMGAMGAAVIGYLADATSITYVFWLCGFLPLIGVLALFLPDVKHT
jgi:MFS transporter, FSR family, fosmidomycin resistance protein